MASADAAVSAAVAVDVSAATAAAAAGRATVVAAVAAMGVAGAGAAREVPAEGAPMLLVTTILVALARASALPASSMGFTCSPGLAAACMNNAQRVG